MMATATLQEVCVCCKVLVFLFSLTMPKADDAVVICQACRHGGHATHITEWFWTEDGRRNHETCPVANCDCRCADEF